MGEEFKIACHSLQEYLLTSIIIRCPLQKWLFLVSVGQPSISSSQPSRPTHQKQEKGV